MLVRLMMIIRNDMELRMYGSTSKQGKGAPVFLMTNG